LGQNTYLFHFLGGGVAYILGRCVECKSIYICRTHFAFQNRLWLLVLLYCFTFLFPFTRKKKQWLRSYAKCSNIHHALLVQNIMGYL